MNLGLKGKCALVTGASRGLGYATARGLACEGVRVVVNSRDPDKLAKTAAALQEETGSEVIACPGDVTDPAVPEQLVAAAVQAFGGLDLLVTNAGGPPPGKFESFDDSIWQKAIELSLLSHVRLVRSASALSALIAVCQCVSDHFLLCQTAHPKPGALQQHPPGNGGSDQIAGAGARFCRNPLQLDLARLDRYRTGARIDGSPRQSKPDHD